MVEGSYRLPKGAYGLLTNSSAIGPGMRYSWELLTEIAPPAMIFSPEHGLMGAAAAGAHVGNEEYRGIPVVSLYGDRRAPSAHELQTLDYLLIDLQDVGLRYYTYIYTMANCLEIAAACRVPVYLLDRPNPLGLREVDGFPISSGFSSFVGDFGLPQQYALSIGELALYIRELKSLAVDIQVLPLSGFEVSDRAPCLAGSSGSDRGGGDGRAFSEDFFTPPSPNLPTPEHLDGYRMSHLFEGTNLSEGRGTAMPFLYIGAPWLDSDHLIEELDSHALPGLAFRKVDFVPSSSKHAGSLCHGVHLCIKERLEYQPLLSGLTLMDAVRKIHPGEFSFLSAFSEGKKPFFQNLLGSDESSRGRSAQEIFDVHEGEALKFVEESAQFHLY